MQSKYNLTLFSIKEIFLNPEASSVKLHSTEDSLDQPKEL